LIIYYQQLIGHSYQILSWNGDKLIALSPPLGGSNAYDEIEELPKGKSPHSFKLFKDDIIKFAIWTGNFHVIVPFSVDWKNQCLTPIIHKESLMLISIRYIKIKNL